MRHVLLLLALLTAVTASHAATKGTYRLQDGQALQLIYWNEKQIRMMLGDDTQLILRDGTTWMLNKQGGTWLAMDMAGMGGLMEAVRKPVPVEPEANQEVSMKALGRSETVAGYEGEVWEVKSGNERFEVVLSDHPDVRELTEGWRHMAEQLARSMGVAEARQLQEALQAMPKEQTGLLRQGDNLILTGVDTKVTAADVELPAGTQKMQMPKIPGFN